MNNDKKQKIGMWKSYGLFWKNYVNFPSTSKRAQYWWPALINVVISILITALGLGLLFLGMANQKTMLPFVAYGIIILLSNSVFSLAILIPTLSMACRRYRDRGISGWWLLLTQGVPMVAYVSISGTKGWTLYVMAAIAIIFAIVHIVICALPSKDAENNKYKPKVEVNQ